MKRLVALFLVLLLSIESFGAIVSDNDGSAFITKAEFDSLKNDFQAQIDQYNTSIDSKIDGAIAAYLAGVKIESKSTLTNLYKQHGGRNIIWVKNSNSWVNGVVRPKAELAIFFTCWPTQNYWSRYKKCYYRFKEDGGVIIAADPTKGGGVLGKQVKNSLSLVPAQDVKGFLLYTNNGEAKLLGKYMTYAPLFEAWAFYYNNDTPSGNVATTIDFGNVMENKQATGTISFTNAYREASGVRVNDKISDSVDTSYYTFSTIMNRERIMLSEEEFGKKSKKIGDWSSNLTNNDLWQGNVSPNSNSNIEFTTIQVKNMCDYAFDEDNSGNFLTKPYDNLHYGHSLLGNPIKLYGGIPLCEASADGTITINDFYPIENTDDVIIAIRDEQFLNETINGNVVLEESADYSKTGSTNQNCYKLNNKTNAKIKWKAKKDTTYYLKVYFNQTFDQWKGGHVNVGEITQVSMH